MSKTSHVVSFALDHPWAVTRPMLAVIAGVLARHLAGASLDRTELDAALVNRKDLPRPRVGSVAVLPMHGVIAPRANALTDTSGVTTFDTLRAQLREALASQTVKTIVLDVDSPGGNVAGATEFAEDVRKARTKKPIVAVAEYTMASAAYWIGAQATEVVAAPSAKVGSIGVYGVHDDLSGALEQLGVKRTYLSAGEGKTDGHEAGPLSAEAAGRMQGLIDAAYQQMVTDIVRGRGVGSSAAQVQREWKAFLYTAADAKAAGLIDRVETLDATLARLLSASTDPSDQRALALLTADTDQEPSPATSQDRRAESALERQLFELLL